MALPQLPQIIQETKGGNNVNKGSKLDGRAIAVMAVMIAVTFIFTMVRILYIPVTEGYIHLGDVAANFAALAFGPWVGLVGAGVGMALADAIGFPLYIVPTFIIHGLQGLAVGYLGWRRPWPVMVIAAIVGQLIVVAGYFVVQNFLYGIGPALVEAPWNGVQGLLGVVGGVLLFLLVRRAYPPIEQMGLGRTWIEESD
jgi:uncharacterized membrane protein